MLSIVARSPIATGLADYCGLAARPFGLALDQRFVVESRTHVDALRDVRRALQNREGLVVVTGAAGTGKTLLCRTLLHQLDTPVCVSVILDPRVSFEDLLRHVLADFGVPDTVLRPAPRGAQATRHQLMRALQRFLASLIPLGAYAVLVIDEAQDLAPAVLEQLRLLLNLETDEAKLLQIVLIGQPPLEGLLAGPALRPLAERITCRAELRPLGPVEVRQYVARRLAVAQALTPLGGVLLLEAGDPGPHVASCNVALTPAAVRAVAELSGGVPRIINLLCDRAIDLGYESRRHTIDARMVRDAARRLAIRRRSAPAAQAGRRVAAATALALAVAGFGTWTWAGERTTPLPPPAPASFTRGAPVPAPAAMAVLPLADSFNVRVASVGGESEAVGLAGRLEAAGFPAFARRVGRLHHVVVGPYLSESEAGAIGTGLAERGHPDAALFVERVASEGIARVMAAVEGGEPRLLKVVALPGGERLSLAFALSAEPQKAALRVLSDRTVELEVGPASEVVPDAVLAPASALSMLRQVAMHQATAANGARFVRARMTFHEPAVGNVRVVGRVVYVDLAAPRSSFPSLAAVGSSAP